MIVDTSALMSVILGEPDAEHLLSLMSGANELAVSAATLVEAGIVAEAKGGHEAADDLQALLADLECSVVPLDQEQSLAALEAWRRFGKGRHPAALNLGDCFAYAAAKVAGRPLLYKGQDFSQTDIAAATGM
ncbi:type II toxin-antitoxin system VapC family toxin [Tessaracoccus terricola]